LSRPGSRSPGPFSYVLMAPLHDWVAPPTIRLMPTGLHLFALHKARPARNSGIQSALLTWGQSAPRASLFMPSWLNPAAVRRPPAGAGDAPGANAFCHLMAKLGLSHPPHAASCFVAYLSSGGAQLLSRADQLPGAKSLLRGPDVFPLAGHYRLLSQPALRPAPNRSKRRAYRHWRTC
jgi:hypothetical protein